MQEKTVDDGATTEVMRESKCMQIQSIVSAVSFFGCTFYVYYLYIV